jgi:hypothetical protein
MSVSAICLSARVKSIYRMMLDGCYAVIDSCNVTTVGAEHRGTEFCVSANRSICTFVFFHTARKLLSLIMVLQMLVLCVTKAARACRVDCMLLHTSTAINRFCCFVCLFTSNSGALLVR